MKEEIKLLFSLVKANSVLARKLSAHGLDFSDFMILAFLDEAADGKLRRVELADKMGLTASGITRMLLPLEKLRFVKRDLDGDDARARYASLTKYGKNLLKDATSTMEMKTEDIFPEHNKDLIKKFTAFLEEISI